MSVPRPYWECPDCGHRTGKEPEIEGSSATNLDDGMMGEPYYWVCPECNGKDMEQI